MARKALPPVHPLHSYNPRKHWVFWRSYPHHLTESGVETLIQPASGPMRNRRRPEHKGVCLIKFPAQPQQVVGESGARLAFGSGGSIRALAGHSSRLARTQYPKAAGLSRCFSARVRIVQLSTETHWPHYLRHFYPRGVIVVANDTPLPVPGWEPGAASEPGGFGKNKNVKHMKLKTILSGLLAAALSGLTASACLVQVRVACP